MKGCYDLMRLDRFFVLALVCLPLVVTAFAGPPPLTPSALLAEIREKGPKQVVRELNQTPNHQAWEAVLGHIENEASVDWLAVAKALRPGTDAGATTDLLVAMAIALPKAPREVLTMTKDRARDDYAADFPYFEMSWVCSAPFFEAERGVVERHLAYAEAALIALDVRGDPELESKRTACLAYIRSGRSTSE